MTEYTQPPVGSSVGHSVTAAMEHIRDVKAYRNLLYDQAVDNALNCGPAAYLVVDPRTYDYLNMRVLPFEPIDFSEDRDKPFTFISQFDYGMPIIRSPFLFTADIGGSDPEPKPIEPWKPSAFLTADAPPKYTQEVVSDTWTGAVVLGVTALLFLLLGAAV